MFYRTDQPHGLRHNPFNALVVPRPIGWISTVDGEGRANLAPYSFFNAVAYHPPQVVFSSTSAHTEDGGDKDSVTNIRATGEFVFNLATWDLREAVNLSSAPAPRGTDEFEVAGLEKLPAGMVAPPRIAASPVHFECRLVQLVDLLTNDSGDLNTLVIGHVVGVHIDESVIVDGRIDIHRLQPIARLGGADYATIGEVFSMKRPPWPVPA
jgi:flavin reductase (DIM6/NTAB) family NADH-FMN oxidoreductase RutF